MAVQRGMIAQVKNGFGFILSPSHEVFLWFHAKELKNRSFDELKIGHRLTFRPLETAERGMVATEIDVGDLPAHEPDREQALVLALMDTAGFLDIGERRKLYFHKRSLPPYGFEQLHEGQRVTYIPTRSGRGPCAIDVRPLE